MRVRDGVLCIVCGGACLVGGKPTFNAGRHEFRVSPACPRMLSNKFITFYLSELRVMSRLFSGDGGVTAKLTEPEQVGELWRLSQLTDEATRGAWPRMSCPGASLEVCCRRVIFPVEQQ